MQVDDRIVDEGEDSQLELGLAGVAVLDHTGVGVGDWAAEGGREHGSFSQLLPWLLLRHGSWEPLPLTGTLQPPGSLRSCCSIWPQTQATSVFAWKFQRVQSRQWD